MAKVMYVKESAIIRENPEDVALSKLILTAGQMVEVLDASAPAEWMKVTAFGMGSARVEGYVKVVELTDVKPKTELVMPIEPEKPEKKSWLESQELPWYVLAFVLLIGLPGIGLIIGLVIYFIVSGRLIALLGG